MNKSEIFPKPNFAHVVLTRFNVRYIADKRAASPANDPAWLDQRFVLFEQYCSPSLLSQDNQDFDWLIFFDNDTPLDFKSRAIKNAYERPRTHVIFCDSLSHRRVMEEISTRCPIKPEWLITTRIDNDDGIHRSFINTIQSEADFSGPTVINAPVGIIFYKNKAYIHKHKSNAFISLVEPYLEASTVFSILRHDQASKFYPIHQTVARPLWLQVIHDNNISNRVRGWRVACKTVSEGFLSLDRVACSNKHEGWWIIIENLSLGLARMCVDFATQVGKKVGKLVGLDLRRRPKVRKIRGET